MRPDLTRTVPVYNPGLTAMKNLEIVINGVNSLVEAAGYVACPEPGLACCPYKENSRDAYPLCKFPTDCAFVRCTTWTSLMWPPQYARSQLSTT